MAALDAVTFVNTESFAGDEGVNQVKVDFHGEVKGGAYRLQNFAAVISLTADEDNVTINADRMGTYDGKNLEDSLTFSVKEEGIIDLNGEISSTYEGETGKENNRISITEGEDTLFTMNVENTVDELENRTVPLCHGIRCLRLDPETSGEKQQSPVLPDPLLSHGKPDLYTCFCGYRALGAIDPVDRAVVSALLLSSLRSLLRTSK